LATLAGQLQVGPLSGSRRADHLQEARAAASAAPAARALERLAAWLVERALEHARSKLLLQVAADWLRRVRVVWPGVTVLERLVASARERAEQESRRRLGHLLVEPARTQALDGLLVVDPEIATTRMAGLAAYGRDRDHVQGHPRPVGQALGVGRLPSRAVAFTVCRGGRPP
jgi:hypothetical protein